MPSTTRATIRTATRPNTALRRWQIWLLSALLVGGAVASGSADAKTPKRNTIKAAAGPKVTYSNGESPAERQRQEEARLRRECKGRPNAGACLGYTR